MVSSAVRLPEKGKRRDEKREAKMDEDAGEALGVFVSAVPAGRKQN